MSTTARHPQSVSQEAKDAMMEYYTLLCRMPHMKPRCPKRPPIEGWSGTHAENLRTQGWSDEAAEISRHLPFLAPGLYDAEHAFIVSLILSLYFSDEELYTIPCFATWSSTAVAFDRPINPFYLSRTSATDQPKPPYLPPHVIYIGPGYNEATEYLLLDTKLGQIISYPNYSSGFAHPDLTFDEYEALAPEEKSKAHPTLPLKVFFDRESTRLKCLVYMSAPCRRRNPSFHFRAQWPSEEAELLALEDEFDADHKADDDSTESESENEQDEIDMKTYN